MVRANHRWVDHTSRTTRVLEDVETKSTGVSNASLKKATCEPQHDEGAIEVPSPISLVRRGVSFHKAGRSVEALRCFGDALTRQSRIYGEEHILVAHILANMGAVHLALGKLDEAGSVLERAWNIKESLKAEHPAQAIGTADVLNNLGNVAYLKGDFARSLEFHRQAVLELRTLPNDKELANALHNMGRLQVLRKDWTGALKTLSECTEVETRVFGPGSLESAATLELEGYAHLALEANDKALVCFSGSLSVFQERVGNVNEQVAKSLVNVAMAMEANGDLWGACKAFGTARDLFESLNVPYDHKGLQEALQGHSKVKARMAGRVRKSLHRQGIKLSTRNYSSREDRSVITESREDPSP